MEIPLYIIDAFTNQAFRGNPAAICPLDSWLDDELMQAIAAENNLSETAFLVPAGDAYELRWFTPTVEVDLCGHATLASAYMLSLNPDSAAGHYCFNTKSGKLEVTNDGDWFYLNFPSRTLDPVEDESDLASTIEQACGFRPDKIIRSSGICIAEFKNEETIRSLAPDFAKIMDLECRGLVVTARGDNCDFVSRFFAPRVGINEDPVTGSIHCSLIPYWHRITGKDALQARQVSARGGELRCRYAGERVEIGGQAILFSQGKIQL